uniref:Uncharacterized protein n=1 Tax=Candidatus Caldatribacterium californiense TaxID=1454726 RepID=A0A7V3YI56_9BACT
MKRFLAGVVILLFGCVLRPAWALETQGSITAFSSYSFQDGDLDYGVKVNLSSTIPLDSRYFGNVELLLKYQDENNIRPLRVREVSFQGVQAPWEEVDFRVGLLEITWGASDVMSPVDVLNPRPFSRDLSASVLEEKIPVPALDLEWYLNATWSLEFFYQPRFVANFVPEFVEKQILLPSLLPFGIDPQRTNIVITKDEPPVSFSSPIWALRARGSVGSFDIALSYVQGYFLSSYPQETTITLLPEGLWDVQVHSGYPKRSILGLEFQGTLAGIEGLTLRGDVAFVVPEKWVHAVTLPQGGEMHIPVFDAPYWKASLGVDYSWNNTYVNLAYLLGNLWEEGERVSPYGYFHVDWQSENGKWKPFLNCVTSLEDRSTVWMLGTEYKPKDNWNVTLTYSVSSGTQGSKLGSVGEGIALEVKYSF